MGHIKRFLSTEICKLSENSVHSYSLARPDESRSEPRLFYTRSFSLRALGSVSCDVTLYVLFTGCSAKDFA